MLWKRLAILSNVIFILIGVGSVLVALTSFMLFDAPGSEKNPYVWTLFFSSLALPITCLISSIVSMLYFFKWQDYRKSLWISLIPCIFIAIIIICLVLIDIKCGGNFSCQK